MLFKKKRDISVENTKPKNKFIKINFVAQNIIKKMGKYIRLLMRMFSVPIPFFAIKSIIMKLTKKAINEVPIKFNSLISVIA